MKAMPTRVMLIDVMVRALLCERARLLPEGGGETLAAFETRCALYLTRGLSFPESFATAVASDLADARANNDEAPLWDDPNYNRDMGEGSGPGRAP